MKAENLRIKIFADGADKSSMLDLAAKPFVSGFTTNPSLMARAGITDYEAFARDILEIIRDKPISFEVFSDEIDEMERQATKIAQWGPNVYVKIPITNTRGESTAPVMRRLTSKGVKVNVTAIMTLSQVRTVVLNLEPGVPSCISVFAGRIADAGVDPIPVMAAAVAMASANEGSEVIWASPREVLNIVQANAIGCHIITVTSDIMKKIPALGRDLEGFSLETVKMFRDDAVAAKFRL